MTYSTYAVPPFSRGLWNVDSGPDWNPTPCAICGRGVTSLQHEAIVIDGGAGWGDEDSPVDSGHMGKWPIGPDCHRKFAVKVADLRG